MARNVEIKLSLRNPDAVIAAAARLSDAPAQVLAQTDVFFSTPRGRLKLRVIGTDRAELIFYERLDGRGPRASRYDILPIADPSALRSVLAAALGERVVVRKRRRLFLVGQTRIHVDEVEDLGTFLELETVLRDGQTVADGRSDVARLLHELRVDGDEIEVAYADLLDAPGAPFNAGSV